MQFDVRIGVGITVVLVAFCCFGSVSIVSAGDCKYCSEPWGLCWDVTENHTEGSTTCFWSVGQQRCFDTQNPCQHPCVEDDTCGPDIESLVDIGVDDLTLTDIERIPQINVVAPET